MEGLVKEYIHLESYKQTGLQDDCPELFLHPTAQDSACLPIAFISARGFHLIERLSIISCAD